MSKYIEVLENPTGERMLLIQDKIYQVSEKKPYGCKKYCLVHFDNYSIRVMESYEQIKEMLNE